LGLGEGSCVDTYPWKNILRNYADYLSGVPSHWPVTRITSACGPAELALDHETSLPGLAENGKRRGPPHSFQEMPHGGGRPQPIVRGILARRICNSRYGGTTPFSVQSGDCLVAIIPAGSTPVSGLRGADKKEGGHAGAAFRGGATFLGAWEQPTNQLLCACYDSSIPNSVSPFFRIYCPATIVSSSWRSLSPSIYSNSNPCLVRRAG
jgi:hypothetical protein